jgi:hypothetical protein
LTEALADSDDLIPIEVFHTKDGYIVVDGFHRIQAYRNCDRKTIPCKVRRGTTEEAILYSCGVNAEHLALPRTQSDKRKAVETLLRHPEWSQWSDSAIAKQCKVSNKTVAAVRGSITFAPAPILGNPKIEQIQIEAAEPEPVPDPWQEEPEPEPKPKTVKVERKGKTYEMRTDNIGKSRKDRVATENPDLTVDRVGSFKSKPTDENYTPNTEEQPVLELVRAVLGWIDLDPCSNSKENPNVLAKKHYTIEDNSLRDDLPWEGKIFLNPPFSNPEPFLNKLCDAYAEGRTTEAIALLKSGTQHNKGTGSLIQTHASAICQWGVIASRLGFVDTSGKQNLSADFDCVLIYFGDDWRRFQRFFKFSGHVMLCDRAIKHLERELEECQKLKSMTS